MIRTERSIPFLESQLIEFDNILKGSQFNRTYNNRRNSILKKLAFQYIRSKFIDHKNTFLVMSKS